MVVDKKQASWRDEVIASHGQGVAVLLNANAKAVNARVREALSTVVPDEHLFLSTTQDLAWWFWPT
jgi:hypothetical protein